MSEEFVIRWEVDEVSKLTDKDRNSPLHHHAGLPWYLSVSKHTPEGGAEHLSFFLNCNDDSIYDHWRCEHKTSLVVVNRKDETATVKNEDETKLEKGSHNYGKKDFVLLADLVSADKGFIEEDKVIVEARITVNSVEGIKKVVQYDFTKESTGSVALKIGEETLHVSRGFLAIESPFFSNLFYDGNDFKEKDPSEMELKDVSVEDFTEVMLATYPSYKPITAESYKSILALAERFQLQRAIDKVETYLIKTTKMTVAAKLLLSEQHKLDLLQLSCLNTFATPEEVKAVQKTDEFKQFSPEFKSTLLLRIFELVK